MIRISGVSPSFCGVKEAKEFAGYIKDQSAMQFHQGAVNGSIVTSLGKNFKLSDLDFDFVQTAKKKKIDEKVFDEEERLMNRAFQLISEQLKSCKQV